MRPRKPYKGVLRRKLPSPVETPIDVWCIAFYERLVALTDHYGLNSRASGYWKNLALQLAEDHVEGFQLAKKPGRRTKPWQWANDLELFVEIYRGREKGDPDTKAYRRLAMRWGAKEEEIDKAVSTLRRRYNDLTQPKTETQRRASMRMRRFLAQINENK